LETEFGIAPAKIAVIPHGPFFHDLPATDTTDVQRQLGVPAGHAFALWQGIIFPYKGIDLLLSAWQQVERENSTLNLVVLGTGSEEMTAPLKQQAHSLGLERVRFNFRFASVEELAAAYRAAQLVVYPYRAITTSGALATGLALGKPIVASDLPVFRELLTNGTDALLVDAEDSTQLANAILRLSADDVLRERLAAVVKEKKLGERSWKQIAHDTAAWYENVLQR
jgi:glycosyltransferase involved in cell wall biosynthesis